MNKYSVVPVYSYRLATGSRSIQKDTLAYVTTDVVSLFR